MAKRISMKKEEVSKDNWKWVVTVPGKKNKYFQLKSSATEYKDANVRVKAKHKQRSKRS